MFSYAWPLRPGSGPRTPGSQSSAVSGAEEAEGQEGKASSGHLCSPSSSDIVQGLM